MKFIILSYHGGMAGDFISSEISKNIGFAKNVVNEITAENMYRISNHLDVINFDPKNIRSSKEWNISEEQLKILENHYNDKRLVIPTHWFDRDLEKTRLPCQGIRLTSENPIMIRFSYCMVWIKSQTINIEVWPERREEILNFAAKDHQFKNQLLKLLEPNNYCNWKFLSYIVHPETLVNNQPDLNKYIKYHYTRYKTGIDTINDFLTNTPRWYRFDIDYAFLANKVNFSSIEEEFKITLDRQSFNEYFEKNQAILYSKAGMKLEDLENDSWIDNIYEYSSKFFNN